MRLRAKIMLGLLALAILAGVYLLTSGNRAQKDLEKTRLELKRQGYKVDLSEFDFSTPPEIKARAARLAATTRVAMTNRVDRFNSLRSIYTLSPNFMPVSSDAALIVWKQPRFPNYGAEDAWSQLHESLAGTNRAALDDALAAAISGPIRFEPIGSGPAALLPYLADVKQLETAFRAAALLALRENRKPDAWTNLLAATCLVTEYTPEPIEISHLVRAACASIAFDLTWNALQADQWTDAELAELQRRWQSVDFWAGLPEMVAHDRANNAAVFELDRKEPLTLGLTFKEILHAPRVALSQLGSYWKNARYRHKGSFEDEKAVLLYYRDREDEFKRALRAKTWSEMRQLPGVTNAVPFTSTNSSRAIGMLNMRRVGLAAQMQGGGFLGRLAEAEARRRLIITVIAIERFRLARNSCPDSLNQITAEFPSVLPPDFMDGQPLRYRRTQDNHFVLYSVGLDCVDNGGEMRRPSQRMQLRGARSETTYSQDYTLGYRGMQRGGQGMDLVWPRPASNAEAERLRQEEINAERERLAEAEEQEAADQWERTARRMAKVQTTRPPVLEPTTKDPPYHGRLLGEWLRNEQALGTNKPSLPQMLTLRRVITDLDPEIVTFEFPMKYEAVTNVGELQLHVDPVKDEDSYEECEAGLVECKRATNGDCLLAWSSIYEVPGKHTIRAALLWESNRSRNENLDSHLVLGPVTKFTVTNLCQFSVGSSHFTPEHGVTLRAKLVESNAVFSAEMRSPAGDLLRTLKGDTSDSILELFWDLKDEHGNACTNNAYDTVFHITLPDSGRVQALRGP